MRSWRDERRSRKAYSHCSFRQLFALLLSLETTQLAIPPCHCSFFSSMMLRHAASTALLGALQATIQERLLAVAVEQCVCQHQRYMLERIAVP